MSKKTSQKRNFSEVGTISGKGTSNVTVDALKRGKEEYNKMINNYHKQNNLLDYKQIDQNFSFEDLEKMLFILHINNIVSPLYLKFPLTILDLLFRRLPEKSEISHLSLLPLVLHDSSIPFVEPYFVKDISKVIQRHSS